MSKESHVSQTGSKDNVVTQPLGHSGTKKHTEQIGLAEKGMKNHQKDLAAPSNNQRSRVG